MKNKNKGRNTAAAAPAAEPDDTEVEESEDSEPTPIDTGSAKEEAPKKPTKEEIKARIARYTDSLAVVADARTAVTEAEAEAELIVKEIHDTSGPGRYKVNGVILQLTARKIAKGVNAGKTSYKFVAQEEEDIIGG